MHNFRVGARFSKMIRTADNGIAIAGTTLAGDAIYIKCDSLGFPKWSRVIDALGMEEAAGIVEVSNGDLVMAIASVSGSDSVGIITTVDANGKLLSANQIELPGRGITPRDMITLPGDKIVLTGRIGLPNSNGMFIISIDNNTCSLKPILVSSNFSVVTIDTFFVPETNVIMGRQSTYTDIQTVTATQSDFCTYGSVEPSNGISLVSLYPNPITQTEPSLNISVDYPVAGEKYLRLCDVFGKEVYSKKVPGTIEEILSIPMSDLSNGIYTVELLDANTFASVWRGKVVKVK